MSLERLQMAVNAINSGNSKKILNWYSPKRITKSQLIMLKSNGINATCRKRDKAWYEIDFVKI